MEKSVKYNAVSLTIIAAFYMIITFGKALIPEVMSAAGDGYLVLLAALALLGLSSAVRSFKQWDAAKLTWFMFFIGTVSFFIAECTYFYLEIIKGLNMDELFPSIGDVFWSAGYIFYLIGVLILIIYYFKSGLPLEKWKRHLFPAGILFVLIVWAMYILILKPIMLDTETDALSKFFYFYYPVADLVIIFPAFILIYITRLFGKGMLSRPWRIIALGFLVMSAADLAFNYLDWQEIYKTGDPIDLLWGLSYWLIGLSGIYQQEIMESI